jgi:hypothetical protein
MKSKLVELSQLNLNKTCETVFAIMEKLELESLFNRLRYRSYGRILKFLIILVEVSMSDCNRISLTAYEINRKAHVWSHVNQALLWIIMAKNRNLPTAYSESPISYLKKICSSI